MGARDEIFEQPLRLEHLLDNQRLRVHEIASIIRRRDIQYVFLAARGTSDNAGRYANYLWSARNRLPIALVTPSLFTYFHPPPILRGALVLAISQSGQSPDVVSVLEEGRRQGCLTMAITNTPNSPLSQAADLVLDLQVGKESAIAATKTYTAELTAVAMLSAALRESQSDWGELGLLPGWARQALELEPAIAQMAQRYRYMQRCVVLGRGFNYATAFEWSLKLKEMTYVAAEPYSSADFQHGPIALVETGFPVMAVAPQGMVFSSMMEVLTQVRRQQDAELVVISDDSQALELAQSPIQLPSGIPEWLTPQIGIIAAQLFAYHLTLVKGYNPDAPRLLHKVTETH